MRCFADSDAFGAVKHLTALVGALNFAFGLFTLDIADRVFWLGTRSVAFWRFANWVANGRAVRIITFPRTLRMAS
jgi:hypothetical protein